jgi:chromosome segregation ATPase
MFKKLFGRKEVKQAPVATAVEASKGYHSCVDTCEKDIDNLETECENLRKDNLILIGKVTALQTREKKLQDDVSEMTQVANENFDKVKEKDERISELEQRLQEADEKADGTPVKYASARKTLTKAKLKQLRDRLEAVPSGATGFGGSCSVYDKKTKRLSVVEFKSKDEALALVDRAEKGYVDIVM